MAIYKATRNVTIGAGGITNSTESSGWYLTNRFLIGDEADLTADQAKQYANHFAKVKEKTTDTNKEKKTGKNK
jgi:hypothetical protein